MAFAGELQMKNSNLTESLQVELENLTTQRSLLQKTLDEDFAQSIESILKKILSNDRRRVQILKLLGAWK